MWWQAALHNFPELGMGTLGLALASFCHHLLRYCTPLLPLRVHLVLLNICELIVCCTDTLEHQTRNATRNHEAEPCCMNHCVEAVENFNVICRILFGARGG
jgi:hypothetical protein